MGPHQFGVVDAITAEDRYAGGCVDCHLNYTDMNMDTRLSTLMQAWYKEVDPRLLEKIRPSACHISTIRLSRT